MEFIIRFFQPPTGSFFLFGPRGTGKSTWARSCFPEALIVDLLDPSTYREYSARPERLRELIAGSPGKKRILIDEVQKVPDLLSVVHGLIEARAGHQFILTGSSARKIRRSGVDLLAGRALLRTLHPFTAAELGKAFRLKEALNQGLVPLVVGSQHPEDVIRSYADLYVQEEVKAEGLVRNVGSFSRFLEAMSLSHASILNTSNVARECQVERKTVENYISILEDLLLAYKVPVFTRRAKRKLVAHPKFYFFDVGVFQTLRPRGPLDRRDEISGAALEGLVVQHLRAWNAYRGEPNTICYWRTQGGVEVDLVVYGDDGLWAIEVKNSLRVHTIDLRSLRTFLADYPEGKALLLYRGSERLRIDDVLCLPCDAFLRALHPARAIDDLIE